MKVFAAPQTVDFCINRIYRALKSFAPPDVSFVEVEDQADLIILYVHGHRKSVWWSITRHKNHNRECAVIQLQLKNSANPLTIDWLNVWHHSKLVWSYYDLPAICREEGNPANFNFYHAPLGVDSLSFTDHHLNRPYVIGIHSVSWSKESLRDVVTAAREVGKTVLNFGDPKDYGDNIEYSGLIKNDDFRMSHFYSQCQYVSGLRRVEGFELPVIEGLLCGARPICFDLSTYRFWFGDLAEYISEEGGSARIIPALIDLFNQKPTPVTPAEKKLVAEKFNWNDIVRGFWANVL